MPPELAAASGTRLYGCDACQEACPWNASAKPVRTDPHLLMPAALRQLPPDAEMDDTAFAALFSGSPIRRIGRELYAANARRVRRNLAG